MVLEWAGGDRLLWAEGWSPISGEGQPRGLSLDGWLVRGTAGSF